VRVLEAAPEVERAGRIVRRLDLEQDPLRGANVEDGTQETGDVDVVFGVKR